MSLATFAREQGRPPAAAGERDEGFTATISPCAPLPSPPCARRSSACARSWRDSRRQRRPRRHTDEGEELAMHAVQEEMHNPVTGMRLRETSDPSAGPSGELVW